MNKRAINHLRKDIVMARLIDRFGPIRHRGKRIPPFESLVRSIIHQQLSGQAAGTILCRFEAVCGGRFPAPETVLQTPTELLRSAGLSRAKTAYILGIAEKAAAGKIPSLEEFDRMSDSEIVTQLTSIKGVGQWTAEMLLIFNLGRPDVLPLHDVGVRRGFQVAHGHQILPNPNLMARHGHKWGPYRTAAALYLWRAADEPGLNIYKGEEDKHRAIIDRSLKHGK